LRLQPVKRRAGIVCCSRLSAYMALQSTCCTDHRQRLGLSKELVATLWFARASNTSFATPSQVYDVSSWAPEHPGGRVVYTYAGKDATDVFAGFHSAAAWAVLKPLYVGELLVRPWSSQQPALLHHLTSLHASPSSRLVRNQTQRGVAAYEWVLSVK
jgi:Cytochrome b5-like Heme/Steroid binding domain